MFDMDIAGIIAILVFCGFFCYGIVFEVKRMKAYTDRELAQAKMYEEILELLKRKDIE